MRRLYLPLLCLLLAGCGPAGAPTADGLIDRRAAIDAATALASISRPEVSGALVEPKLVLAEQMTLGQAVQRMGGSVAAGQSPDTPVWVVELEGLWQDEAPNPGATAAPTPATYTHYTFILDARTGLEIQSSLKP